MLKDTLEAQRDFQNSKNASENNDKEEEIIIDDESYNCDKEEIQRTSSS